MSEIEAVAKLREWEASDNEQGDAHEWFAAVHENNGDDVRSADEHAKAEADRAEADGWGEVASTIEQQAPSS